MTLPEGVQPSGPTQPAATEPAPEPTVTETPAVTEPVTTDPAATAEEPAPVDDPTTAVDESASDAELRAWAKDNGIEDVPASGRLSAAWRDQIITAMAAALDPKDEASAEPGASSPPSTSPETTTTETTAEPTGGESPSASTEEAPAERPLTGPGSDQPEFAHGGSEYRSVFQAPNTFVTGQAFTA